MLPDELPSPEQIEIYRTMPPEKRYELGRRLYWSVRHHKTEFLRKQHPEWTQEQLKTAVREIFARAGT